MLTPEAVAAVFAKHGTDKCLTSRSADGRSYAYHYAHFLGDLVDKEFTLLELGVLRGESLHAWHELFPKARIVGADRMTTVRNISGSSWLELCIGEQDDPNFVASLTKFAPFAVIIDDMSHMWRLSKLCVETLFPFLQKGGYYFIEDTECFTSAGYQPQKTYFESPHTFPNNVWGEYVGWLGDVLHQMNQRKGLVTEVHCFPSLLVLRRD